MPNTQRLKLDPKLATEPPDRIVRVRTIVIQENVVVAPITEDGAAAFSNIRRGFDPTRGFRIERSKRLQRAVLFFR